MGLELAEAQQTELQRILALPRRPVVNCERDSQRRWAPQAQALIEVVTAQYTRGPRLSCGCQPRRVEMQTDGHIVVFRQGRPDRPPPPPLLTTATAFIADNAHNRETVEVVGNMRPGQIAELPGLGANFCLTELNPVQAWILREAPRAGGIFGLISVGAGKSLSGILVALAMPTVTNAIIFGKPDQRRHYRVNYLRAREHFRVPSMIFEGMQGQPGWSFLIPGEKVLRFVPYSQLSNPKSTELLESINPDMIIADESHCLSSRGASRTMRFLRYMTSHPNVVFCNWSGSTIKKSLKDASHLAAHALGMSSPYPLPPKEVEKWAAVMDPLLMPDTKSATAHALYGAFAGTMPNADARFLSTSDDVMPVREGFRERVVETAGVISTLSSSVTASITISEREAPRLPESVRTALMKVRNEGLRPADDMPLVETMEITMCAREAGAGFSAYWSFPRGESKELIEEWKARRKVWNKALRRKLLMGERHMDSPQLCTNAAQRAWQQPRYEGDLPVWPEEAWPPWCEIKDQVEPDPRVMWIDDFLAKDAAAWAQEHVGIVWCQSIAFGKKVAQLAKINYHGGGANAEEKILAEDGKKSIVVSIDAHSTGRDGLQFKFYKQLVAEPPSSGDRWEQLLGRLAREGQEAETVETWIYGHTGEYRDAMIKAVGLAEFIQQTTPNRQLLLAADIDVEWL